MSSSSEINANFPIPGITQSSKGFRDNFAIIKEELGNIEKTQIQIVGAIESNVGCMNGDGTTVILEIPENNLESAVISALGGMNIALVPWVSNTFAFLSGDSSQIFNVADAASNTEAVNMQTANLLISQASLNYLPLSGGILSNTSPGNGSLTIPNFLISNSITSNSITSNSVITFNNAVGEIKLPNQTFQFNNDGSFFLPEPSTNQNAAVQYQQLMAIYNVLSDDITNTEQQLNDIHNWTNENFAALNGNSSEQFNVAQATQSTQTPPLYQIQAEFAAINGSVQENFAANGLSGRNILITSNDGSGSAEIYSDNYGWNYGNGNNDLVIGHGLPNANGSRPYYTVFREDGQLNLAAPAAIPSAATQLQQVQTIANDAANNLRSWVDDNFAPMSGNGNTVFYGQPAYQPNQFVTLGQFPYQTGNSGYMIGIPNTNGTRYIQYGYLTGTSSGQYSPFPTPFPNGCSVVVASDTGGAIFRWSFENISRFGCTVLCAGNGSNYVAQFIAIGW